MELPEESPAIDKAAEAREARRRRLLESSNKRLGKITGREHDEGEASNSKYANCDFIFRDL